MNFCYEVINMQIKYQEFWNYALDYAQIFTNNIYHI